MQINAIGRLDAPAARQSGGAFAPRAGRRQSIEQARIREPKPEDEQLRMQMSQRGDIVGGRITD